MTTTIQKWGNSQGVRIPKTVLDLAQIGENDYVEFIPQAHSITIRLVTPEKKTLEQLFADWDGEYEVDDEMKAWEGMKPVGREVL